MLGGLWAYTAHSPAMSFGNLWEWYNLLKTLCSFSTLTILHGWVECIFLPLPTAFAIGLDQVMCFGQWDTLK